MQTIKSIQATIGFPQLARSGQSERVRETRDPVNPVEAAADVFEHSRGRQSDDPQPVYGKRRKPYR